MGTCKIVGWCGNTGCIEGCVAQKSVEAERKACAMVCAEGWKNGIGEKHQGDVFAEAILKRSNVELNGTEQRMCKCGMPWEPDMDQFGCWSCGADEPVPNKIIDGSPLVGDPSRMDGSA